ncbi:hypothetical protein B0T22DRAFT_539432 [Podospora appendiculata]|uniref:Uncharacterized protein n=1 Tax=Podospora appendiculata TaxID=314037 RepID=A0AAE0X0V3_9PEZI|nr:hypothetical protein B0T22DRAFT_539432 [Podospora appendiculata]
MATISNLNRSRRSNRISPSQTRQPTAPLWPTPEPGSLHFLIRQHPRTPVLLAVEPMVHVGSQDENSLDENGEDENGKDEPENSEDENSQAEPKVEATAIFKKRPEVIEPTEEELCTFTKRQEALLTFMSPLLRWTEVRDCMEEILEEFKRKTIRTTMISFYFAQKFADSLPVTRLYRMSGKQAPTIAHVDFSHLWRLRDSLGYVYTLPDPEAEDRHNIPALTLRDKMIKTLQDTHRRYGSRQPAAAQAWRQSNPSAPPPSTWRCHVIATSSLPMRTGLTIYTADIQEVFLAKLDKPFVFSPALPLVVQVEDLPYQPGENCLLSLSKVLGVRAGAGDQSDLVSSDSSDSDETITDDSDFSVTELSD